MSKRLHYSVRSVVALCCISFLLFSVHLDVNAGVLRIQDMVDFNIRPFGTGSKVSEHIAITVPYGVTVTSTDITNNGGTYTGTGTGTQKADSPASYADSSFTARMSGTSSFYGTVGTSTQSGTITENGSVSGTGAIGQIRGIKMDNSSSGTISLNMSSNSNGQTFWHVSNFPIVFEYALLSGESINASDYYYIGLSVTNMSATSSSTGSASIRNVFLSDANSIKYSGMTSGYKFILGQDVLGTTSGTCRFRVFVDFDIYDNNASLTGINTVTFKPSLSFDFAGVKTAYKDSVGQNIVSDTRGHELQQQQIAQEETAQSTRTSIFNKISDFFGSFFQNLIGVFVPEDGFFTTWFNNLNTLLEAKLGILYYPFSVIIQFFTRCTSAFSSQSTGTDIVFPAIEFTNSATGETYTFLSAQHINLADFNITTSSSANSSLVGSSGFGSLVDIIRTFNAFVILFCLLSLLRTKLNLVLRGDNNDN